MRAAISRWTVIVAVTAAFAAQDGDNGPRAAATAFGRALVAGRAEALRPVLPRQGRVRLTLARLGPEEGAFGANQVEAVFRDFFASGKIASFDITRCESDPRRSALAHATATIEDREGRSGRISVHLGFEPEGGRWVLREVKESPE